MSAFTSLKHIKISNEEKTKISSVIDTIMKDPRSYDFRIPVDWKAIGLFDYPEIIKKPMDLGTVESNLKNGKYDNVGQCIDDLCLIWKNCQTYNVEGSDIWKLSSQLEKKCNSLLEKQFKSVLKNTKVQDVKVQEPEPKELSLKEAEEEKEVEPQRLYLTLEEKINLTEKVRKLPNEGLAEFVRTVQKECPAAFEDMDTERIQVRVDYLDKRTNNILHQLMSNYLK